MSEEGKATRTKVEANGRTYWVYSRNGAKYTARSPMAVYCINNILDGLTNDEIAEKAKTEMKWFNRTIISMIRRRLALKGIIDKYINK